MSKLQSELCRMTNLYGRALHKIRELEQRLKEYESKVRTKRFTVRVKDKTADGGVAKLMLDPTSNRLPSTGELITTKELAKKYVKEVCGGEMI